MTVTDTSIHVHLHCKMVSFLRLPLSVSIALHTICIAASLAHFQTNSNSCISIGFLALVVFQLLVSDCCMFCGVLLCLHCFLTSHAKGSNVYASMGSANTIESTDRQTETNTRSPMCISKGWFIRKSRMNWNIKMGKFMIGLVNAQYCSSSAFALAYFLELLLYLLCTVTLPFCGSKRFCRWSQHNITKLARICETKMYKKNE